MTKEIALTQGRVALVDDADWKRLSTYCWCFSGRCAMGYVTLEDGSNHSLAMHRFIMKAPQGMVVHHRNGNPLDNRRDNLRTLTKSEHGVAHRRENIEYETPYRNETNKTEALRTRVTPECLADIITLAATFDSTPAQVTRWALDAFRGKRVPVTAEDAQEVLREAADGK